MTQESPYSSNFYLFANSTCLKQLFSTTGKEIREYRRGYSDKLSTEYFCITSEV